MTAPSLSSETIHVSSVAIGGRAVLIGGRSGAGKSDLALRLIDRGARLISDDYTFVRRVGSGAIAEGHDGRIVVEDREDGRTGARFVVRFSGAQP